MNLYFYIRFEKSVPVDFAKLVSLHLFTPKCQAGLEGFCLRLVFRCKYEFCCVIKDPGSNVWNQNRNIELGIFRKEM